MKRLIGLLLIASIPFCAHAQAQQDWRSIIMTALQSPSGAAESILIGPMADKAKQGLKTTEDIRIKVTTVASLPQAGCKRLEVLMYIPDKKFPTTDGGQHEFRSGFQLNVCPDGRPPEAQNAN